MMKIISFSGAIFLAIAFLFANPVPAEEKPAQKSFPTPKQAINALVKAIEKADDAELLSIIGPGARDLIFSGDEVAVQKEKIQFLKMFKEKNRLENKTPNEIKLIFGNKNIEFPAILIKTDKSWRFDIRDQSEVLINKRIEINESHAIQTLREIFHAQREYFKLNNSEFAQQFISSAGERNGLYWDSKDSETKSPLNMLITRAIHEGYQKSFTSGSTSSFHGYIFKILKAQGKEASGGPMNYVTDNKMTLGFALVAYPAKYAVSGFMTFIVNHEGIIYEKDLGENTDKIASSFTGFAPDPSWRNTGQNLLSPNKTK